MTNEHTVLRLVIAFFIFQERSEGINFTRWTAFSERKREMSRQGLLVLWQEDQKHPAGNLTINPVARQ